MYQNCFSMDLTTSACYLSDLYKEVAKQLFLQKIGESILHDSVDCIVAKTLSCFQTHSKKFPNSSCITTVLLQVNLILWCYILFHYIPFKLVSNLAFNAFKILKKFVKHFKHQVGMSAKIPWSIFDCAYLFNLTCKTVKTTMMEQREKRERKTK